MKTKHTKSVGTASHHISEHTLQLLILCLKSNTIHERIVHELPPSITCAPLLRYLFVVLKSVPSDDFERRETKELLSPIITFINSYPGLAHWLNTVVPDM